MYCRRDIRFQLELVALTFDRVFYARIHLDGEWLSRTLAVGCQLDCVAAGQRWGAEGITRRVVIDRRDRILAPQRVRWRVMQVPHEAVHSRLIGQNLRRTNPVDRDV